MTIRADRKCQGMRLANLGLRIAVKPSQNPHRAKYVKGGDCLSTAHWFFDTGLSLWRDDRGASQGYGFRIQRGKK